jgi:hypothetical protein
MPNQTQPYEKAGTLTKKEIMLNNFIGGLSWALGATVGISLIFTILTMIARYIDFIPIFGTFISDLLDFILTHNKKI